jgi:hypothetical protein
MSDGTGSTTEQRLETRIGTLAITHDVAGGYPTRDTIEKLYDERDFQRAWQAYLWALPLVSFEAWQCSSSSTSPSRATTSAPGILLPLLGRRRRSTSRVTPTRTRS